MYWPKKAEELNAIEFKIMASEYPERLSAFEAGTDFVNIFF